MTRSYLQVFVRFPAEVLIEHLDLKFTKPLLRNHQYYCTGLTLIFSPIASRIHQVALVDQMTQI